jgi:hypothetical protein
MTVKIQSENTFKKACSDGINLFLGSGFSLLAKNAAEKPLPLGAELLEELLCEFKLDSLRGLSLSQVCTILESEQKDRLYAFLRQRFSVVSFDSRFQQLEALNVKTVFTTNIDNLLSRYTPKVPDII